MRPTGVVGGLLELLRDEDSDVHDSAAFTLGELGNDSTEAVSGLLRLLCDEESVIRSSAASALGKLGHDSTEVVSVLLGLLRDEDSDVHDSAASALVELGNASTEAISCLLELLRDEDFGIPTLFATYVLGTIAEKAHASVVPAIAQWIEQHSDSRYVGHGIDALWYAVVGTQS
jgi:HEAT repeat protein